MLYMADIGSDLNLGAVYFRRGDSTWAALTFTFVFLPWAMTFALAVYFSKCGCVSDPWFNAPIFNRFMPVFAAFGVLPIAMTFLALTYVAEERKTSMEEEEIRLRMKAMEDDDDDAGNDEDNEDVDDEEMEVDVLEAAASSARKKAADAEVVAQQAVDAAHAVRAAWNRVTT